MTALSPDNWILAAATADLYARLEPGKIYQVKDVSNLPFQQLKSRPEPPVALWETV